MSLREGEEYDQVTADRDIRSLMRTGLFEDVDIRLQPITETEIDVVFDIRPKFRIAAIIFDGNQKIKDRRLERELTIFVNEVLNERKVNDNVLLLKEYYLKKGYSQVRITYEIDRQPGTGFGNVIFRIREGGKYKISKVRFTGNDDMKSRKLRRRIDTKKWSWLSVFTGSGKFDSDKFEDDLETLRDIYREDGFLDIEIDPSRVKFSYPSKKRMVVEIDVDEGKQYQVGKISFEGNDLYKDDILSFLLTVKPGSKYRPEMLDEDVTRIEDFYGQFGYMETRVRLQRVPNITSGDIDLVYQIYESEKFLVESIDIEGNTKTKSTVVIRELALSPGSTFDSVRMDASRMRLENTRYFEDVNVTPQTTHIPGRRDLKITFREGRTGNFSFGAGFSSLEGGVFFIELTQSNFDIWNWRGAFQGDGQKFRLRAQLGSESSQLTLAFDEPYLFERRLGFGFQIFQSESDFVSDDFDSFSNGFEVHIRKRLIELIEARLSYSLVEQDFKNFRDITERDRLASSIGTTSAGGLLLLRDTRDRILNTFKGARIELDLNYAGDVFGGDFNFYRVDSRNAFYLPISRWHTQTIEFLLRLGVVKETAGSSDVPFEQRFFLGGPNDVRGFEFRDVGPIEANPLNPDQFFRTGGKTRGMFSAEYSIGFTEGFRGAIFYDGGFVNKAAGDFSLDRVDLFHPDGSFRGYNHSGWNDNYGVGIRISVMGTPLRLDYAIPLTTDGRNDDGGGFEFNFGGRF